jgi:hypothetical protein
VHMSNSIYTGVVKWHLVKCQWRESKGWQLCSSPNTWIWMRILQGFQVKTWPNCLFIWSANTVEEVDWTVYRNPSFLGLFICEQESISITSRAGES